MTQEQSTFIIILLVIVICIVPAVQYLMTTYQIKQFFREKSRWIKRITKGDDSE